MVLRLELQLGLDKGVCEGQGVSWDVRLRARVWGMQHVDESPHKDSTRACVCVFVCVNRLHVGPIALRFLCCCHYIKNTFDLRAVCPSPPSLRGVISPWPL